MISDEVQMLLNRMKTHPEEFFNPTPTGFRSDVVRAHTNGKWDTLMTSLLNNKADLEFMFDPEEIEALRACAKEAIQERIRATIVRQIVGGEGEAQGELNIEIDTYATDSAKYVASMVDVQTAKKLKMELGNYLKMKAGCGL